MAGVTVNMIAEKDNTLQKIHEKIHYIKGAEQVSKSQQTIHDVEIWVLVYEKYYTRIGGYASMTVVLTEHNGEQTACVVSSGGGEGIVNYSLGANRKFAKECVDILTACGFRTIRSDPDALGECFLDRILK